jgi:type I restriction enzyme M protein
MAVKKSELYRSLWSSCDELRGGMDASQYKDYVLTLLFVKYVSDKYAGKPNPMIEIPDKGGFSDMVALRGDKNIGEEINKIIHKLAEANGLEGVIDVADFNDEDKLGSGLEMQKRLSNLVGIFANLDLSAKPGRGRRPPRRRIRVPHAAFRHRVGEIEGAILYARRGFEGDGESSRHSARNRTRPFRV